MKTRKLTVLILTLAMLALCACDAQPTEPTETPTNVPETVETTAPTEPPSESESAAEAPTTEPTEPTTEVPTNSKTVYYPDDIIDWEIPAVPELRFLGEFESLEEAFKGYTISDNYYNYETVMREPEGGAEVFRFANTKDMGCLYEVLSAKKADGSIAELTIVTRVYTHGKLYDVTDFHIGYGNTRFKGGSFCYADGILGHTGDVGIVLFHKDGEKIYFRNEYSYDVFTSDGELKYEKYNAEHYLVQSIWDWLEYSSGDIDGFALERGTVKVIDGEIQLIAEQVWTAEQLINEAWNSTLKSLEISDVRELIEKYHNGEIGHNNIY